MASTGRYSQFLAITVTIPDTAAHRLIDLIQATLNTGSRNDPSNAPTAARNYQLSMNFDLNASGHIYVGDQNVSATQRCVSMFPGTSPGQFAGDNRIDWRSQGIPLSEVYVLTDTTNAKLDVGVWQ